MFLERKIQNLFFLIFIIILVWVTPLYLVKAKVLKISQKNPSFAKTINSKSNNTKLHSPAKLTFDISDLDDIEKTKEERKYFYKLTFEDNDLLKKLKLNKELNKDKKASEDKLEEKLEDKSFVCHLNTSIFDSDNNPLTDLFDIKCSYRKSGTKDSFVEFENLSQSRFFYKIDIDKKRLERQERDFSFFKIDLKEWAYDIQIEIKTKKLNPEEYKTKKSYSEKCDELLEKYKKLENKKIKLKCELDITDKDNYPVYLFENISKTIKNISKTNFDSDFILSSDVKILSNPIWLVFKKNNEFLIWDLIFKQEVKYKEYQDLMNLYHSSYSSWKKIIEEKIDNDKKSDLKLSSLKSQVDSCYKNYNLDTSNQIKKEKYESSDKEYKEHIKKKEDEIEQKFNSNNFSRIKLYFLKEIYDINNSDTHSSLHVKFDWEDIGEIKYDGGKSNKSFDDLILKQYNEWQRQNSGKSIERKPSEIKETCDRLKNLLKEKLSVEEYSKMMYNLNKENWNIVENTVGKAFAEYLKNNYTSVGNKKILQNIKREESEQIDKTNVGNEEILRNRKRKELEQIDKSKKDYMKKIQIRINKDYMKKTKENAIAVFSSQSQFVTPQILNEDETICYATNT
ncbi:hypothetical protein [Candidatus Phytoplasma sp. AldY-WA1]|uniref:hypothetical protein n=1 Tax=Candidatus Phytoplasma sp. AldY-WA1 TaxID=2852100 RepID=UPI002549EDB6|nr:hypothetical protein [Candidatus Phytoplasma sp. AldY-WA1]